MLKKIISIFLAVVIITTVAAFAANSSPSIRPGGGGWNDIRPQDKLPETIVPDKPDTPDDPDNPVDPDQPVEPDKPVDPDKPGYDGIIYDQDGDVAFGIPEGEIIITPIRDVDNAKNDTIKENLGQANDELAAAGSIKDLCPEFEGILNETNPDVKEEDLLVKDVFHMYLNDEHKEHLSVEGNYLNVIFNTKLSKDEPFYVLYKPDGGKWQVLNPKYYSINEDGTVTVNFDSVGSVAFVTTKAPDVEFEEGYDEENPAVKSPKTGDSTGVALIIVLFILSIAVVVVKRRRKGETD